MLAVLLLLSPCVQATPVDAAEVAPCTGIIVTTQQAKQALKDRAELKARKQIKCPACPESLPCPKLQPPPVTKWAAGGMIAGILSTVILSLAIR